MHRVARRPWPYCLLLGVAILLTCSGEPRNLDVDAAQSPLVRAAKRAARPGDAPTVILLSLDGIRYDYLDREALPAFARMKRDGAAATRLLPVFPSITFPTHVSLATGTYADRHGIVANRFWDNARGELYDYSGEANWLEAEPIWIAAERQGIPAAVYFWVGSESDWRGRGATHRKTPFDASVPESRKVDQILAWLDMPVSDPDRPGLILAYWHGTDRAAHRFGPDSSAVDEALREQDRQLGRLLAGLDARGAWPTTTLLVVSDHGMVEAGDGINVEDLLDEAGIRARSVHAGAVAHVHLDDKSDLARARAALEATPGVRAFAADELPAELRYAHPSRSGDVLALAEPPYVFSSARRALGVRLLKAAGQRPGMHGYDVREVPEMAGILLAAGRGVAAGRALGDVRAIDVAASIAALLAIDAPAQSEGEPIQLGAR